MPEEIMPTPKTNTPQADVAAPAVAKVKAPKRSLKKQVKPSEFGAPDKVATGFMMFSNEKRAGVQIEMKAAAEGTGEAFKIGEIAKKIGLMWKELSKEDQDKYNAVYKKKKAEYDTGFAKWKTTAKYQDFVKENANHKQKIATKKATDKAKQSGMPSRPLNAYALFASSPEISQQVTEELAKQPKPEVKVSHMAERAKIIKPKWDALGAEGQKVWKDKFAAEKSAYAQKLEDWHKKDEGKEYLKALEKGKKDKNKALGIKQNKRASASKDTGKGTKKQKTEGETEETPDAEDGEEDEEEEEEDEEEGEEEDEEEE